MLLFSGYLIGAFCEDCTPPVVFSIFFWLGYCNSVINPCVEIFSIFKIYAQHLKYVMESVLLLSGYLIGAFCEDCTLPVVFSIFFWLGYCNSVINPCVEIFSIFKLYAQLLKYIMEPKIFLLFRLFNWSIL